MTEENKKCSRSNAKLEALETVIIELGIDIVNLG